MPADSVLDLILKKKIIAIVRGIPSNRIAGLIDALLEGGISCIEVTYDQSSEEGLADTLKSLSLIRERFSGRVALGAGTVLSAAQVDKAVAAGAGFILSPNFDPEVVRRTKAAGAVSIPGAFTPSEIVAARNAGADIVKLFPASFGGPAYVKAVRAPLPHIPLSAVGGITPENMGAFFEAGVCSVGVGGNLVSPALVAAGDFGRITETARRYSDSLRGGAGNHRSEP